MNRYSLKNSTHAVEFEHSPEGLRKAKAFRASHPEFKRRRIFSILQLIPDKITLGEPFHITYRP